jgi:FkbM family methyltransferase
MRHRNDTRLSGTSVATFQSWNSADRWAWWRVSSNDRQSNRKNHVVVEANPQILSLLTENRDRNGCEFEIVHGAVGEQGRSISIHLHENALLSSAITTAEKKVEVPGVTLEDILRARSFDRCALICDIEGAEVNLIRDELPTLRSRVETFIVEFHPWINGQDLDVYRRISSLD